MGKGKQKKASQIKSKTKMVNLEAAQDLPMTTQGNKPLQDVTQNQKK